MPTDTNEHARRVLYHPDGEAIDRTDDNNAALFQRAHEFNLLLSGSQADGYGEPLFPGQLADPESFEALNGLGFTYGQTTLAPWPGAAFVFASGVARQLGITAGPIVGIADEPWQPTGEEFAIYRHGGGSALTTAIGDAANPRIDLVEVKLEYVDGDPQDRHFEDATTRAPSSQVGTNKERRIEFTYQIKQGAAAANPTYPTPTVGFVAMAAVYVPALHNAVHNPDNIRDLRAPFGCRAIDVDLKGMHFTGVNPWVDFGMLAAAQAASDPDTDRVIVPCPVSTKTARVIAVGIQGDLGADARFALVRIDYANGAPMAVPTITELCDLSGIYTAPGFTFASAIQISDALGAAGIYKGLRAANTRVGTPLWTSGWPGGPARIGLSPDTGPEATVSKLAISFGGETGANCRVGFVRFWVAEGLG